MWLRMWPVACFYEHGDETSGSMAWHVNTSWLLASQELLGILWCCCPVYRGLVERWFWTPLKGVTWSIRGLGSWKRKWRLAINCFPVIVEQTVCCNVCYVPYKEERVHRERRVADRLEQEVPLCHISQRLVFCNRSSRVSGRHVWLASRAQE